MYKVLIVDDERIIRENIAKIINWNQHGFELIGTAANGIEALRIVEEKQPELIITDMKMPVISGNQLAEKVLSKYPDTEIAILSGHDDFEFVSESMKFGIKHYLLKPCSEKDVINILVDVNEILHQKEERKNFIRKNNEKLEKIIPLVKEQFIRDFIMSKHYTEDEMTYFMKLFGVSNKNIRLVLAKPSGEYNFNTLFALSGMIKKNIFNQKVYFITIINKYVVVITEQLNEELLENALTEVMDSFRYLMNADVVFTYSKEGPLEDISQMFQMVQKYLDVSFYFGESCIISYKDVEEGLCVRQEEDLEVEALITAVRSGNKEVFTTRIEEYFDVLMRMKPNIDTFKFYCIELASGILRQCPPDKSYEYIKKIVEIQEMDSFEKVYRSIVELGSEIVDENYSGIVYRQNKVVETMLHEINQRLSDENLTLKSLASEVMYMNSGYLSKLFSKEMGITFSNYIIKLRMEKAKDIIKNGDPIKMYEVAEQIGMGNNPQYFGQLFKKFYGMTPSDYKAAK